MNEAGVVSLWRRRVEELHREWGVLWQRHRFAEALLERAEELEAVGDLASLALLEKRLENWIARQRHRALSPRLDRSSDTLSALRDSWKEESVVRELQELRHRLNLFRQMIPRGEWNRFLGKLAELERLSHFEEEGRGELMRRLRQLRQQLVERCFRSMGSIELRDATSFPSHSLLSEHSVGPYNSSAIASDLLGMISQTDPIWTGDLIAVYGSLYRLSQQLS